MRLFALVFAFLAFPSLALAAKKPKKDDPPKVEKSEKAEKAEAKAEAPKESAKVDARQTNRPVPLAHSNYDQWGTRGGAVLGGASGIRAQAFGGNHFYGDGYGFGGLEAVYFFRLNPAVDFGLGLRFAAYPLGVAPGLELRLKLVRAGAFHLAASLGAWAPLTFAGMYGGITIGAHVEPGILASYFFADNIEFIFGFLVPMTLHIIAFSFPVPEIGFAGRLGVVYTLKKSNIGFIFLHDIAPGFYTRGGFPRAGSSLATARATPAFDVGVNFMLGVQVKL
jgi:hypothetical protein